MIIQYVYTSPEYDYSGDVYTHNLFQKLNKNVSSSLAVFSEQRIPPECSTKMQLSEEGTYIKWKSFSALLCSEIKQMHR